MRIELSEGARDALVNAEHWTGGRAGICSDEELEELVRAGLVGGRGGLTRTGVLAARRLQAEWENRP